MTLPITRGAYESLAEYEARAPHGEGVCPRCDGYGEVVTRHYAATRDEPAGDETVDCDECEGGGTVPCDPGEECDPAIARRFVRLGIEHATGGVCSADDEECDRVIAEARRRW